MTGQVSAVMAHRMEVSALQFHTWVTRMSPTRSPARDGTCTSYSGLPWYTSPSPRPFSEGNTFWMTSLPEMEQAAARTRQLPNKDTTCAAPHPTHTTRTGQTNDGELDARVLSATSASLRQSWPVTRTSASRTRPCTRRRYSTGTSPARRQASQPANNADCYCYRMR